MSIEPSPGTEPDEAPVSTPPPRTTDHGRSHRLPPASEAHATGIAAHPARQPPAPNKGLLREILDLVLARTRDVGAHRLPGSVRA